MHFPKGGPTWAAVVWSVTGASWTYWTWMSLPWSGEPSTPVAAGSEEATAISWAPWSTLRHRGDSCQHRGQDSMTEQQRFKCVAVSWQPGDF